MPIGSWLQSLAQPSLFATPAKEAGVEAVAGIDALLLRAQTLLSLQEQTNQDHYEELPDRYLRTSHQHVITVTNALRLDQLLQDLDAELPLIASLHHSDIQKWTSRFMPFLEHFFDAAGKQLAIQAGWMRAVLKLDFVLCSIVRNICMEGFCQPKESEEGDASGDGGETVEATGLGGGAGDQNVSKEIQEESQVEGLQGDDEVDEGEVERAEEGNAIEMAEDFGGKMQDVEANDEDEVDDGSDGSEQDPDEQLGQLDASDDTAIDEKIWGDESGPKDTPDQSKTTQDDHSKTDNTESEMTAKDNEQSGAKRNDKAEEPSDAQPEMEVDQTNEDELSEPEPNVEDAGADGAPMDQHIQDADVLELPDDLNMDIDKDAPDTATTDDDGGMEQDEEEPEEGDRHRDFSEDDQTAMDEDMVQDAGEESRQIATDADQDDTPLENAEDGAVTQADTHSGGDGGDGQLDNKEDTSNLHRPDDEQISRRGAGEENSNHLEEGTQRPEEKDIK